ncbi:MAG: hypothetical protein GC159_10895 [Phycisphaera sp.]|nr:hypothetical protein [Phycisphaera sp.]
MKIVGIGMNKTGTKTLGACLRHWGCRHQTFSAELFDQWVAGCVADLIAHAGFYDSFEDWPWPLLYRQLDTAYPGSRFILTTRISSEVWFDSLCRHAERTGPTRFRTHVYGHAMPHDHRDDHIAVYERHNDEVRRYFATRPDQFIELCWERGDGWEQLADFLGRPVPAIPFPHLNKGR